MKVLSVIDKTCFPSATQTEGPRIALAFTFTPRRNLTATYLPHTVYTSQLNLSLYIIPLIRLHLIKSVHLKWCAGVRTTLGPSPQALKKSARSNLDKTNDTLN